MPVKSGKAPGRWFAAGRGEIRQLATGELLSNLATQISLLTLPSLAVLKLHAGATETSLLFVAEYLPAGLLAPVIGAVTDRSSLRLVLVLSDVGRLVLLVSVAVALMVHGLIVPHLMLVAAGTGLAGVAFQTASVTAVRLVSRDDQLAANNSLVSGGQSVGQLMGPGLAGIVIQLGGLGAAVVANVFTLGAVAITLSLLAPLARPGPEDASTGRISQEVADGVRIVRSSRPLSAAVLATANLNLSGGGLGGLFFVYCYQKLDLTAAQVSVTLTVYSAAGVLGTVIYSRLAGRVAPIRLCLVSSFGCSVALLLVPFASMLLGFVTMCAYQFLFGSCVVVWGIANTQVRQQVTPIAMLGRVHAVSRAANLLAIPIGAGLAALGAHSLGLLPTMFALAIVALPTAAWYLGVRLPPTAQQPGRVDQQEVVT